MGELYIWLGCTPQVGCYKYSFVPPHILTTMIQYDPCPSDGAAVALARGHTLSNGCT